MQYRGPGWACSAHQPRQLEFGMATRQALQCLSTVAWLAEGGGTVHLHCDLLYLLQELVVALAPECSASEKHNRDQHPEKRQHQNQSTRCNPELCHLHRVLVAVSVEKQVQCLPVDHQVFHALGDGRPLTTKWDQGEEDHHPAHCHCIHAPCRPRCGVETKQGKVVHGEAQDGVGEGSEQVASAVVGRKVPEDEKQRQHCTRIHQPAHTCRT
mmetsp:Transcript_69714/g.204037  ORF Transcript_69714/g.204037 Transcript_69714/m.204037 type:complete len:212 (-) Transcript_69714:168-803(-)